MSKELDYINMIGRLVQKYPGDFFNSVAIAQACLETGFGVGDRKTRDKDPYLDGNNAFGYKAKANEWKGDYLIVASPEEYKGAIRIVRSRFRKYLSVEKSVKDHANMLSRSDWYKKHYAKAIHAKTPEEQCMALVGTYATDSKYGDKLIAIINKYGLKAWDNIKEDKEMTNKIQYPKIINENMLKENNMGKILGAIIHNDYGSKNGTAEWYRNWLRNRNKALGIAHYYVTKNAIARFVNTYMIAYHAGNWSANAGGYIGYEVCQSRWDLGVSTEEFLLNEDMVLRQVAEDFHFYKLQPNRQTVRLHKEFSSTSCPHRSWDLHGKNVNTVKDYFIAKIKYYMSLGKTVKEIIDAENKGIKTEIKKPVDDARNVKVPAYSKPLNPFKPLKVGDKVTIREGMTYWYKPSDNSGVKPSKDFTGKSATIAKVMDIKAGTHYSKRAYLLKEFNSWILEQDLVEPRSEWVKVEGNETDEKTTPNEITTDGEGYFYLKGVKYKLTVEETK